MGVWYGHLWWGWLIPQYVEGITQVNYADRVIGGTYNGSHNTTITVKGLCLSYRNVKHCIDKGLTLIYRY